MGQTIEHHMRKNSVNMKWISVTLLFLLAMLVTTCSTEIHSIREPLSTPSTVVLPMPTHIEAAQVTLTRVAFRATLNAQIDLTANAFNAQIDLTTTAFAAHMPTRTPTFTPVPRDTLPAPFTPIAALLPTLTRPETTSDDLITLMLRQYVQTSNSNPFYVSVISGNFFGIQVVKGAINADWNIDYNGITNNNKTLSVLFTWPQEPTNSPVATVSVEEFTKWQQAKRMLIKDLNTGAVYWVKWVDYIPWRPIELEGWITTDLFVFSQFGNPWHGFLTAIDARKHKFLLTIQLEY